MSVGQCNCTQLIRQSGNPVTQCSLLFLSAEVKRVHCAAENLSCEVKSLNVLLLYLK